MGGTELGHCGEGGPAGDFRRKVWSMSGGPYRRPKHWRRNTAIAMFGVFLTCIHIAMKSAELELRRCLVCGNALIIKFVPSLRSSGVRILEPRTTRKSNKRKRILSSLE